MGRDDLICVPGMMGYDGIIEHLPASLFGNISRWAAKTIVDIHRASIRGALVEYPMVGDAGGQGREVELVSPGSAELLLEPSAHIDGRGAESPEDQTPQDEIMADDSAELFGSGVQIDGVEADDVAYQGITNAGTDHFQYSPYGGDDAWGHPGGNATDPDSQSEDDQDHHSAYDSHGPDYEPVDAAPLPISGYDTSPDAQEEDRVSENGQAVPIENVEGASGVSSSHEPDQDVQTSGAVSVVDLTTETDVPQQNSSLRPALQLLYKIDTFPTSELPIVCEFFGTSGAMIDKGLVIIPGTTMELTAGQLAFIYQFIKRSVSKTGELNGQILADAPGLGKSHCSLGLIAVIRLLVLTMAHVSDHPEKHNHPGHSSPCPSGNPYGIQCVCVSGSLSSEYARRLTKGPMLVLSPPHIVEQWVAKAAVYFLPAVAAKESDIAETFVDLLSWKDGRLMRHPFGDPETDAIDDCKEAPVSLVTVGVTASGDRISRKDYEYLRGQRGHAGFEWLREEEKVVFKASFQQLSAGEQSKSIVFVSTYAISQGRFAKGISTKVPLSVSGRGTPYEILFPLPIISTLVVYDECHTVKDDQSKFWKQLFHMHQMARSGELRSQWCLLSATPASTSPNDISPICRVLFEGQPRDSAVAELKELNTQFTQMQVASGRGEDTRQQGAAFADRFGRFLQHFVIARDRASLILGRVIDDPAPKYDKVAWTVSVPPGLVQYVERLGAFCREKLPKGSKKLMNVMKTTITTEPVFTQYYCAGIMPGIAAAQVVRRREGKEYPSSAPDIARDIAKNHRGTLYKFMDAHKGHEWLTRLASVLTSAHNDRGPGSDEPPKHVLVLAATPSLTGHIYVNILHDPELRSFTTVELLSSTNGSARNRHQRIQAISDASAGSQKTTVVVSTAGLVGTGTDTLTFCSYLVILGELFNSVHEEQAIGRVCRRGQELPVHVYYIRSDHHTHELVRKRNSGRRLMLSDLGYDNDDTDEGGAGDDTE